MRFVLFPGFVVSKADGDQHYIGETALRHLYRIPPDAACVTYYDGMLMRDDDIECRPRYDGQYPVNDAPSADTFTLVWCGLEEAEQWPSRIPVLRRMVFEQTTRYEADNHFRPDWIRRHVERSPEWTFHWAKLG